MLRSHQETALEYPERRELLVDAVSNVAGQLIRGLEVDDQLELNGLPDRLRALEDWSG